MKEYKKQIEDCGCINYTGNGLIAKYCEKHLKENLDKDEMLNIKKEETALQSFANWLALDKERFQDFEVTMSKTAFVIRRLD